MGWHTIRFIGGWVVVIQRGTFSLDRAAYTGVLQKGNLAFYLVALLSVYWFSLGARGWRFLVATLVFVAVVGLDCALVGDWWALPLAGVLSLVIVATFAYSGAFAHVLAGIIANAG